jgi:hypothetical protein
MSALSIRLPNSLHDRVRDLAAREGISINQLVATALAEKMSALMTADYLETRARRGSRARFLAALARVADVEPDPWDRLEVGAPKKRMQPVRARRQRPRRSRREAARPRG